LRAIAIAILISLVHPRLIDIDQSVLINAGALLAEVGSL
jgi:hypothetical protein